MLVVGLLVLAAPALPLLLLTALGAHRRGLATPRAVLAGLFSPVTWGVWYVRDERPYRRASRHTAWRRALTEVSR
jgi:hypothetical protein